MRRRQDGALSMNREAMVGGRERLLYLKLWKGGASHGNEGEGDPQRGRPGPDGQPGGRKVLRGAGARGRGEAKGRRSCG